VDASKHAFLRLLESGFSCNNVFDNMCTLACSSGFFASEKGRGVHFSLSLVCDVLMFYPEGRHSRALFTLPLLHAESVADDLSEASPSSVVVLQSQFRQCASKLPKQYEFECISFRFISHSLFVQVPHFIRLCVCL
jgi:hypothetical protein